MTLQNPKLGSWTHAAATTTMCPAPSSTHGRSSSCPTLRTRASGFGICQKELVCRPFAGTMIASGCWGLIQTSTCLLLVCEHSPTLAAPCTGRHRTHCDLCGILCGMDTMHVPFMLQSFNLKRLRQHSYSFIEVLLLFKCDSIME